MLGRRYTVLIADRSSGVLRRVTIKLRTAMMAVAGVLMLPILIGLGARWSARVEMGQLAAFHALEHLGEVPAALRRKACPPSSFEPCTDLFILDVLEARVLVRDRAHVAAALHVVLTA